MTQTMRLTGIRFIIMCTDKYDGRKKEYITVYPIITFLFYLSFIRADNTTMLNTQYSNKLSAFIRFFYYLFYRLACCVLRHVIYYCYFFTTVSVIQY